MAREAEYRDAEGTQKAEDLMKRFVSPTRNASVKTAASLVCLVHVLMARPSFRRPVNQSPTIKVIKFDS